MYEKYSENPTKESTEKSETINRNIELLTEIYGTLLVFIGGGFSCGRSGKDFVAKIIFRFSSI